MTEPRQSRRPKDSSTRKPLEQLPGWLRLLASLPFPFWYAFSTACAWLVEHVVRYRRGVVEMQIRKCLPEFDDAAVARTRHAFYRNFTDVVVETIKSVSIDGAELDRRMELVGGEAVREHARAGRSAVLVTSHNCNWEWALLTLSRHLGIPMDAAYKPLHHEWSDRVILVLRSRFGAIMVPDRRLLMHVLRRRRQPRAIAMVADQDPTLTAVRHVTRFFGYETNFYLGPATIARAVGAPIFYVAIERTRRGHYRVSLDPLVGHDEGLSEGAMIDRYAARIEAQIRAHPADWLWAYGRWKKRRRREAADAAARQEG